MLCMEDRTVVAYCCRKTKRFKCGIEGENVVAYGRLPSPVHASFLSSLCCIHHSLLWKNYN